MYELMVKCNNYFDRFAYKGKFEIVDNTLLLKDTSKFIEGEFVRFFDSLYNFKVYEIKEITLNGIVLDGVNNEIFDGYLLFCMPAIEFKNLEKDYKKNVTSESVSGYYSATFNDTKLNDKLNVWKIPYISKTYILNAIPIYEFEN